MSDLWKAIFGDPAQDPSRLRNAAVWCIKCKRHIKDADGGSEYVVTYNGMCWECARASHSAGDATRG